MISSAQDYSGEDDAGPFRDQRVGALAAISFQGMAAPLPKAIREAADDMGVPVADAERVMRDHVLPPIRVVPLRIGDYLHPRIAGIRSSDPSLPKAMRRDPDDLGTAALAESWHQRS